MYYYCCNDQWLKQVEGGGLENKKFKNHCSLKNSRMLVIKNVREKKS